MLSFLFNVEEGGICMRFDDAGREEVLHSLKLAIKERDHDFFSRTSVKKQREICRRCGSRVIL